MAARLARGEATEGLGERAELLSMFTGVLGSFAVRNGLCLILPPERGFRGQGRAVGPVTLSVGGGGFHPAGNPHNKVMEVGAVCPCLVWWWGVEELNDGAAGAVPGGFGTALG